MTTLISTLIGGFLAILGGLISVYFTERIKGKKAERNLAWAFHGEIGSLCKIIRIREFPETFRKLAEDAKDGRDTGRRCIKADSEYFHVFKNSVTHIGILVHGLPEQIVSFYVQATAILEDLHSLSSGFHDDKPLDALVYYYEDIADLLQDLLKQGDEILHAIERKYS
jgi:hypothetical protein